MKRNAIRIIVLALAQFAALGLGAEAAKAAEIEKISGTISVPENRKKPDARMIELPYRVLKARAGVEARKPLFVLNGGPGASNFSLKCLPEELRGSRDIVLMGYRGVDGPSALPSREFGKAVWGGIDPDMSVECLRGIGKAFSRFIAVCREQGIDPEGYTVYEVESDIESLRETLGYESIDLYGISYGTRLCYLYARDYPQRTGRLLFMGGNPPGHFVVPPEDLDPIVEGYSTLWNRDLAPSVAEISSRMPKRWLWWPVDSGMIKMAAQILLYQTDTAPIILSAYRKAYRGDASALAGLTMMAPAMTKGTNLGDLFMKGLCDFEAERDYVSETSDPRKIGRTLTRLTFGAAQQLPEADRGAWMGCGIGQIYPAIPNESLVMNGSLDAANPYDGVERDLMPLLPNGRHLKLVNYGHGDFAWRDPAGCAALISDFLDEGEIAATPVRGAIVPEKPKADGSLIAWAATGATAVLTAALSFGLFKLIMKIAAR
jgi:pimeloyl-ACP methyl ester carboxylesterase